MQIKYNRKHTGERSESSPEGAMVLRVVIFLNLSAYIFTYNMWHIRKQKMKKSIAVLFILLTLIPNVYACKSQFIGRKILATLSTALFQYGMHRFNDLDLLKVYQSAYIIQDKHSLCAPMKCKKYASFSSEHIDLSRALQKYIDENKQYMKPHY